MHAQERPIQTALRPKSELSEIAGGDPSTPIGLRIRLEDNGSVQANHEIDQRLIARCFTPVEMAHLAQDRDFQRAVTAINTLDDFEQVVALGHLLITDPWLKYDQ